MSFKSFINRNICNVFTYNYIIKITLNPSKIIIIGNIVIYDIKHKYGTDEVRFTQKYVKLSHYCDLHDERAIRHSALLDRKWRSKHIIIAIKLWKRRKWTFWYVGHIFKVISFWLFLTFSKWMDIWMDGLQYQQNWETSSSISILF